MISRMNGLKIDLSGRVVLVFGGGSSAPDWGNGKAAAMQYARAGAKVVVTDIDVARARETLARIEADGGEGAAIEVDVSDSGSVESAVDCAVGTFGSVDVVHNNVALALFGDPVEMSVESWDKTMAVNLRSVFLSAKHALPIMLQRGRGVFTSISSILAVRVSEYPLYAYNASKAGIEQFTRTLAVHYAARGIRANVIEPGLINTPQIHAHSDIVGMHGDLQSTIADRDRRSPTGKMGEAWDIANASVLLASDLAGYINGQVIAVDGGITCKLA